MLISRLVDGGVEIGIRLFRSGNVTTRHLRKKGTTRKEREGRKGSHTGSCRQRINSTVETPATKPRSENQSITTFAHDSIQLNDKDKTSRIVQFPSLNYRLTSRS